MQVSNSWMFIAVLRTPLHCAASCNNTAIAQLLVQHGACVFTTALSDRQKPSEKCEPDEDDFESCLHFLQGELQHTAWKHAHHSVNTFHLFSILNIFCSIMYPLNHCSHSFHLLSFPSWCLNIFLWLYYHRHTQLQITLYGLWSDDR